MSSLRLCPHCGTPLDAGSRFCVACGAKIRDAAESQPSSGPPPAATPGGSTVVGGQITPEALHRSPATLIGHMVGEYQVTHFIGKGGMGWVFAGVHPIIGKKVAIKVLKSNFAYEPEIASAFINEAKAANAIGSDRIVDIFAFGQLPSGNLYFVMELLEGMNLSDYLAREGRLSLADARIIFPRVLEALEAAHEHGIVHRDLKPENVFLILQDGMPVDVRLLDFGIAKFNEGGSSFLRTQTGIIKGTPLYMSPEQCRADDTTPASDLYSFGVMLYQAVTGQVPFKSNSYGELVAAHLSETPLPPSAVVPLPAGLEALILQCMEKDPAVRPSSAREVKDRLVAILDDELAAPARREALFRRRFRRALVVLAILAAAGFGVFAALRWQKASAPPPPPPPPVVRPLVVMSAHPSVVNEEIAAGFSAWLERNGHPPVRIEWMAQKEELVFIQVQLKRAIQQDRKGEIDVMLGGGESLHRALASVSCVPAPGQACSQAVFTPSELVPHVPEQVSGARLYDAEGRWFGVTLSGFGYACNETALEKRGIPFPKNWEELSGPAFFQRLVMADPRTSSSAHMVFETILQAYSWEQGWRILLGLGANVRDSWLPSSQGVLSKLADDPEALCAAVIDYFFYLEKDDLEKSSGIRLRFAIPPETAYLTADPVSVLARAPHPAAAKLFVQYLLTDGQRLWVFAPGHPDGPRRHAIFRLPVDSRLYREPQAVSYMNPFESAPPRPFDSDLAARRRNLLSILLQSALVLTHRSLRESWNFHLEKGQLSARLKRLAFPVSQEQFEKLLRQDGSMDILEMKNLENRWMNDFHKAYRQWMKP